MVYAPRHSAVKWRATRNGRTGRTRRPPPHRAKSRNTWLTAGGWHWHRHWPWFLHFLTLSTLSTVAHICCFVSKYVCHTHTHTPSPSHTCVCVFACFWGCIIFYNYLVSKSRTHVVNKPLILIRSDRLFRCQVQKCELRLEFAFVYFEWFRVDTWWHMLFILHSDRLEFLHKDAHPFSIVHQSKYRDRLIAIWRARRCDAIVLLTKDWQIETTNPDTQQHSTYQTHTLRMTTITLILVLIYLSFIIIFIYYISFY